MAAPEPRAAIYSAEVMQHAIADLVAAAERIKCQIDIDYRVGEFGHQLGQAAAQREHGFGIIDATGRRIRPSQLQFDGGRHFFLLPSVIDGDHIDTAMVRDDHGLLQLMAVVRLTLSDGRVTAVHAATSSDIGAYSAAGEQLTDLGDSPSTREQLWQWGEASTEAANQTPALDAATNHLTTIWRLALGRRRERIGALVRSGVITARLEYDRDLRGWEPDDPRTSYWGIFGQGDCWKLRLSALSDGAFLSVPRSPWVSVRHTMVVALRPHLGSVYFASIARSGMVLVQCDMWRMLLKGDAQYPHDKEEIFDVSTTEGRRGLTKVVLTVLDALLELLETGNQRPTWLPENERERVLSGYRYRPTAAQQRALRIRRRQRRAQLRRQVREGIRARKLQSFTQPRKEIT